MFQERTTLLTGSTGLLGQFLLADLLRSRCPVTVLVRDSRVGTAQERVELLLRRFEDSSGRRLPRPIVLTGDLTLPGLGLDSRDHMWLKRHCHAVIHSAASLSFKPAAEHPDNEPFRTNVEGTRQLVEFCQAAGINEFHDISSSYVCGLRSGRILETDGDFGQSFSNDYEQSKLIAEQLVHDAGFQRTTVYRPSIVVDPTPGSIQLGDRTIYYAFNVLRLIWQRFGEVDIDQLLRTIGLTGNERKNVVDASWVARTIVEIYRRPKLHGMTYHLTNPCGTSLRDLIVAFQKVLRPRRLGTTISLERSPDSPNGWGELTGIIDQFVETFTPYFRDDPVFDQTHLKGALAECQTPNCPEIDHVTLEAIAKQQLASRAPGPVSGIISSSLWFDWVRLQSPIEGTQQLNRSCLHLTLTGQNGGNWTCFWNHESETECFAECGHVAGTFNQLYTSATTWEEILGGQLEINQALQSGLILLESEDLSGCGAAVADLIKLVRSHSAKLKGDKRAPRESEVYGR